MERRGKWHKAYMWLPLSDSSYHRFDEARIKARKQGMDGLMHHDGLHGFALVVCAALACCLMPVETVRVTEFACTSNRFSFDFVVDGEPSWLCLPKPPCQPFQIDREGSTLYLAVYHCTRAMMIACLSFWSQSLKYEAPAWSDCQ
jgi:hypothetical protein